MAIQHDPEHLYINPLPVGNAVDVFVYFPYNLGLDLGGADRPIGMLVLRKNITAGAITGPTDAGATTVFEGIHQGLIDLLPVTEVANLVSTVPGYGTFHIRDYDSKNLINDESFEYAIWAMSTETREGGTSYSNPVGDTVQVAYKLVHQETDWPKLIEERLQIGLATMVERAQLDTTRDRVPQVFEGYIIGEKTEFPVVTIHHSSYNWDLAVTGESVYYGRKTVSGSGNKAFSSRDGRHAKRTFDITVWSLNHVERNRIGTAVRYLLLANHPVWKGAGAESLDMSAHDEQGMIELINREAWLHKVAFTIGAPAFVDLVQDPIIKEIDVVIEELFSNRIVC